MLCSKCNEFFRENIFIIFFLLISYIKIVFDLKWFLGLFLPPSPSPPIEYRQKTAFRLWTAREWTTSRCILMHSHGSTRVSAVHRLSAYKGLSAVRSPAGRCSAETARDTRAFSMSRNVRRSWRDLGFLVL